MQGMTPHAALRMGMLVLGLAVGLGGCAPTRWNGAYQHWGTVREVLRHERTQGRVVLGDVTTPSTVGLGALVLACLAANEEYVALLRRCCTQTLRLKAVCPHLVSTPSRNICLESWPCVRG